MLQFMGLQRVGHDSATELNWTELKFLHHSIYRKTLNVLTFEICFLINSNLLMFLLLVWGEVVCCKIHVYPGPPLPLQNNPSEPSESLSPGFKSSVCLWIKLNYQLLGCANFFFNQQCVIGEMIYKLMDQNRHSKFRPTHICPTGF